MKSRGGGLRTLHPGGGRQYGEAPSRGEIRKSAPPTKPFRNSKLRIRATMLLKIKGDFMEARMSLKTIRHKLAKGSARYIPAVGPWLATAKADPRVGPRAEA